MNVRRIEAMLRVLHAAYKVSHETDRKQIYKVGNLLKTALNEYQEHFQDKLQEHGLESINGEDPEKLKAFFTDMKESWDKKGSKKTASWGRPVELYLMSKKSEDELGDVISSVTIRELWDADSRSMTQAQSLLTFAKRVQDSIKRLGPDKVILTTNV